MKKVLLIGTQEIINGSIIEDNVDVKLLSKTLSIVQETGLKPILGDDLYTSLIDAVYDYKVSGTTLSALYSNLLSQAKPYLIAKTTADFIIINNYKISNKGLQVMDDNSSSALSDSDLENVKNYYDNLISTYKKDLVKFLKDNNLLDYNNDVQITSESTGWFLGLTYPSTPVKPEVTSTYTAPEAEYTYQQIEELRQVLLVNTSDIINNTVIEDNVDVKLLARTIQSVQEVNLKPILSENMYLDLVKSVYDNKVSGSTINGFYLDLLSVVKPYLINKVVAEFIIPNQYKMSNKGLQVMDDNSSSSLSDSDLENVKNHYDNLSTNYKIQILEFLKKYGVCADDDQITSDATGWYLPSQGYIFSHNDNSIQGSLYRDNDRYITGATYSNGTLYLTNNSGTTISVSGFLTGTTEDIYTTGVTLNGNTLIFNTTSSLSAYTIDLSSLVYTAPASTDWSITGNSGTNPATNYIGTRDNVDVVIARNGVQQIKIQDSNLFIGKFAGNSNTGIPVYAIGLSTAANNTGNDIIAIGDGAANSNTGSTIIAIGTNAGNANEGGSLNALGYGAGNANRGDYVVAIGSNAGNANTLDNVILLGTNASASTANQLALSSDITSMKVGGFASGVGYVMTDVLGNGILSLQPVSGGTSGIDVYVTGGTYNNGTVTFRNNTGGTFTVTGLLTTDTNFANTNLTASQDRTHNWSGNQLSIENLSGFSITNVLASTGFTAYDAGTMSFINDTFSYQQYAVIPNQPTNDSLIFSLDVNGIVGTYTFLFDVDNLDGTSGYYRNGVLADITTCLGFYSPNSGTPVNVVIQVEKTNVTFDDTIDLVYFDGNNLKKANFTGIDTLQSVTDRGNTTTNTIESSVSGGNATTISTRSVTSGGYFATSEIGNIPSSFGLRPYLSLSNSDSGGTVTASFKVDNGYDTYGALLQRITESGTTLGLLFSGHPTTNYLSNIPLGDGTLALSVNGVKADRSGNIVISTGSTGTYLTASTFNDNYLTLINNTGGTLSTLIDNFTGLTVNGDAYVNRIMIESAGNYHYIDAQGNIEFHNENDERYFVAYDGGIVIGNITFSGTGSINSTTLSASRDYFLPDRNGTFALVGDIGNITASTFNNNRLILSNSTGGTLSTTIDVFTGLTSPTLLGGTGTTSSITIQAKSGTGTTGNGIIFKVGSNGATTAGSVSNAGAWDFGSGALTSTGSISGFNLLASGLIRAGATSNISWNARSIMNSPADGQIQISNAAGSSFTRLNLGTSTSTSPAIAVSGTGIQILLADASAYTGLQSLYHRFGSGSPEGVITAPIGCLYSRTDGGAGTSLYVKESGTGNTGWVAK